MKNTKFSPLKLGLYAALIALCIFLLRPATAPKPDYVPIANMTLIAHAGGGLPQGIYSNAKEAFDLSAKNGFTLIEADFNLTKDGSIVLMHDWDARHYQYFSKLSWMPPLLAKLRPRRATGQQNFMARTMNKGLHQMDLDALLIWMRAHPQVKIITDVKGNNIDVMAAIKDKAPQLQGQFIVQIYAPQEYAPIAALGYEHIIFTAYRSPLSDAELINFARANKLYALTIPAARASAELSLVMTAINTPVFAHTLNTEADVQNFKSIGVTGLYTDYLYPAN